MFFKHEDLDLNPQYTFKRWATAVCAYNLRIEG